MQIIYLNFHYRRTEYSRFVRCFLTFIVLFFPLIGRCGCPTCPGDSSHVERLLQSFTEALNTNSQNIVLGRKLSSNEITKLLKDGVLVDENTQNLLNSGRVIQAFEVLDSLRESKKTLVYFTPITMEIPSAGSSGTSFFPSDGSVWLFIDSSLGSLDKANAEIIDLPHGYGGAIADMPNNGLGVNARQLLSDLKKIESTHRAGLKTQSPQEIHNGFALEVLRRLSADKLSK